MRHIEIFNNIHFHRPFIDDNKASLKLSNTAAERNLIVLIGNTVEAKCCFLPGAQEYICTLLPTPPREGILAFSMEKATNIQKIISPDSSNVRVYFSSRACGEGENEVVLETFHQWFNHSFRKCMKTNK